MKLIWKTLCLMILVISCSNPLMPTEGIPVKGCLQTGFSLSAADVDTLSAIKEFGFQVSRIDVQRISLGHIYDQLHNHAIAGVTPLAIIWDAEQLNSLPEGGLYELRNEPDLEGPSPAEYRKLMLAAAQVAQERNQTLYVGSISNLNERGFNFLHAIRPLPPNVRVSIHRYGNGVFEDPHSGFKNRESEIRWLKAAIGDTPYAVTEFGYSNEDMSEQEAARRIRKELEFWYGKAEFACLYQLNDGPTNMRLDQYGIRRLDGTWKPSAYVFY